MCVENSKYKKIMLIDKSEKKAFPWSNMCISTLCVGFDDLNIFHSFEISHPNTMIDIHRSSL